MTQTAIAVRFLLVVMLGVSAPATAAQEDGSYVVRELAPGVFAATAPEGVPPALFAASLVVEGEDGVLVVDSGQRPELAGELIEIIQRLTDRPVRWVVNTHWHGDHVWGNATFRAAYPGARILSTAATRDSVAASSRRQLDEQIARHGEARRQLAAMRDTADADLLARIQRADSVRAARIAELRTTDVVVPDSILEGRTEIDLGGRTAVFLPLGPAHTPGDAAVWVPDAGVLAVGDLLEEGELWLDGADLRGWTRALDVLAGLSPRVTVAAHGGVDEDGRLLAAGRGQLRAASAASEATSGSADPLFSVQGLTGPEAVRYDPDQDVYFIASFGEPGEEQRDGNGFITRASAADGRIEALRFMTGTAAAPLHMPRGMFIRGDTLWVADVDGVHGFLRRSGAHAAFVDFRELEPGFLNDIAAAPGGPLHVTDTGRGRVYRIRSDGIPEIAIEDARTGPPNGIAWDPIRSAFLLAPWEDDTLRAWDPATGTLSDLTTLPGGHFDGLEVLPGGVLVAEQDEGTVLLVDRAGPRTLFRVPGRPADLGLDTRRGRVAVPYIALGRVDVWPLPAELLEPEP